MSEKSLGEEFRDDLIRKAVFWGPATAGAILLGPVGVVAGIATSVAIVCSGGGNGSPSNGSDQGSKS
jgi:hypothetical protein